MPQTSSYDQTERILICAPFGRDGTLIDRELRLGGFSPFVCASIEDLCASVEDGAGALLIGDQALPPSGVEHLAECLANQPPWSDLPVLIMTSGGGSTPDSRRSFRILRPLGNFTLLERPVRPATLISSVRSAIRSRRHQYEIRTYVQRLQESEQALRESEQQFRTLANSIPHLVWMTDANGQPLWFNERYYRYTGATIEQLRGAGWHSVHQPDELARLLESWRKCMETGEPFDGIVAIRRADGVFRRFLTRAEPLRDTNGRVVRWFGTSTDIDQQVRAEEQVRQANRDLEQFAYSASHDLQEPLRTLALYSELLQLRYTDRLDADGVTFLQTIITSATRMSDLIRDLLAYTRLLQAKDEDCAEIDPTPVLTTAVQNLEAAIRESKARVELQPLPRLCIQAAHLQQLFENLIGNALKYRGEQPPVVQVYPRRNGSGWEICVQDNGIGIEPQYHTRIFGIFKRLHDQHEYEGTGIGLALCQKIVERYRGRIWVESEPGKGSTFCFTLGENTHEQ